MEKTNLTLRFGTLSLIIFLAAFSRLIPHPPNFAPIGAMALFGAAYFSKKYISFLVPILAMWISDIALNNIIYSQYFDHFVWFYQGAYWTYASFIIIGLIGFLLLKRVKVHTLLLASLASSVLFFLISNFGVWYSGIMYPKDFNGLISCYTAAIPFLKNTMIGDLAYCAVLFGTFEFAQYKLPSLKTIQISN